MQILVPLCLILLLGCTNSGDDDDEEDSSSAATSAVTSGTTTQNSAAVQESNPLSGSYPSGLAISVFPQATTSLRLDEAADNRDKMTAEEKADAANERLIGEGDCFSADGIGDRTGFTEPTCYEFDSDLMPFARTSPAGTTEYGTLDGTDGNGEACLVAFARSQMSLVVARLEKAMFMVEAMLCQAKKNASANGSTLALPTTAGESLDFTSTLTEAASGTAGMTITLASITKLEDIDSRAVYHNKVSFTDPGGRTNEINLVHSPAADGSNDTYNGTLWTIESGGSEPSPGGGGAAAPAAGTPATGAPAAGSPTPGTPVQPATLVATTKKRYLHINYAKTSTDGVYNIKAELRRANIADTLDPITEDGELNLNIGADFTGTAGSSTYGGYGSTQSNDIIEAIKYISFDMNPDTNAGSMAYWMNPGGSYYENARGFIFNISADTTTELLSGCATTGSAHYLGTPTGISIRRSIYEGGDITLTPRGYYHPFADQNQTTRTQDTRQPGQHGTTITKQCFAQNTAGTLYELDTTLTTSSQGYDIIESGTSDVAPPDVKADAKKLGSVNKK